MKRLFFVLIFCPLATLLLAQKPVFKIKYSEPLAVFMFVERLSAGYPANPFKTGFEKSTYNTDKYKALIARFDTLSLDYAYEFTEFPYGSKIPGMTRQLIKKNLISSDNLADFKLRSPGLVTNSALSQLVDVLTEFTPVYNELIYSPNKDKFEAQLKRISDYVSSKNIAGYFEEGLRFYNSSWDNSIPFELAFYPLPNSKGFTAEAFYNNAVSAIQTGLNDYNELLSVMLHEIYHILYDEQSLKVKTELAGYFRQSPSAGSSYAALLLNEALATALGNGYVYAKLNGRPDTADWYNWKYINLMAKQLYPMVKEYMEQKKPIDKSFIDAYISLYDQKFPNWINEDDHTMTYRYILSAKQADFDVFRQLYPYCSLSVAEDELTEAAIEKMQAAPITKIIVISKNNQAMLELIKRKFPELSSWNYKADREFKQVVFLKDKTQLYIINQYKTALASLLGKQAE